ncbi:MAG: small-conductance mechanosensitive channel [Octadecabacter sp.]|jgi:small-conductance mechanosensitive channel
MGIAVLYNWDHCEPGAGVADSCFCDVADLQSVCAFHRALYAWIWITLWLLVQGVFILSIFFVVVRLISHQMSVSINRNEGISPSKRVLFVKLMPAALYGFAFFVGLQAVGFNLTGLAVLSGAIVVVIV